MARMITAMRFMIRYLRVCQPLPVLHASVELRSVGHRPSRHHHRVEEGCTKPRNCWRICWTDWMLGGDHQIFWIELRRRLAEV